MAMNKNILIKYESKEFQKQVPVKKVINWMESIISELDLHKNTSVSIYFTSNEIIQELNQKYLNKDYPTDVLSFSQMEGENADFIESHFLGDIIISVPFALRSAHDKNQEPILEIYFLLLHGLLHLIGYDHENDHSNEKAMMDIQYQLFTKLTGVYFE